MIEADTDKLGDRKRALEEDEAELIITDHPELYQENESDQVKQVDTPESQDEPPHGEQEPPHGQVQRSAAEQVAKEKKGKNRKPFKRSKPGEADLVSATLSLRLLIPTNYSGIIIGKSGATIAGIKERSDSRVVMSEVVTAAPDRILTIVGMPEEAAQAVYEVAKVLIRAENQQYKTDQSAYQKLTMRFLIPDEIVGAIIGKKAVKVKEIQQLSNARVSAEQGLLIDSTERKINISGDANSIRAAIVLVSF